jgi:hypothetical protein
MGSQAEIRIQIWRIGFEVQISADQGPVVMERAAQFDLKMKGATQSTRLRHTPATSRIEQVSFMDQDTIHPKAHLLCPPTHPQTGMTGLHLIPGPWPSQLLLQTHPLTAARPNQQTPRKPVRTMVFTPWLLNKWPRFRRT